ncbi:response regulator [Maridesulfovibrio sp. FT414]|uniref:response regulator n=1 Tax=Maridesulfovibrio sp. FT414 TaxID=2979469 RepID=UPI003D805EE5
MKDLHNLLKRQLKRHLNIDAESLEGPLLKFVQAVNDAYQDSDADRRMLERSLELSSAELMDANMSLTRLLEELEERVEERTSELQTSQLALKESEERLRVLYEAAPVGIFQSRPEGQYLYANKRLARMYGYGSPEELVSSVSSIASTIYADPEEREWVQVQLREQGRLIGYETRRRRKDGSVFWASLSIQSCVDPETGRTTHYDGFIMDITVRKEAEEKLRLALEAAEGANRAKSIFLANMSHEIRTPLNGIIGLAEIMLGSPLNSSQERFMRQLKSTSYSLLSVLNDILDFSKIEANRLVIESGPVHIRELVADCLRLLYVQARDKSLELLFRIGTDVPEIIEGDGDRIRQVMLNIVSNAIKFTESGEILVEVAFENTTPGFGMLYCSIHDTGPGIPKDKLESVFNAFEQIDGSLTRSRGGTGLGLTISYQLVSLMGGRLYCTSELGKGSSFNFSLPLRVIKDNSSELITVGREELQGLHMLVADLNSTNRSIIREMLENWGGIVDEADSVTKALSRIEKAVNGKNPYQLIVCDINLPGMEGRNFSDAIAKNPLISSALVVMLGGVEKYFTPDRDEVLANAFLYKPVTSSDLLSAVMQALSSDAGLQSSSQGSKINVLISATPKRILLVEDTPLNQRVAKYMIEGWGHSVTIAENGHDGFEQFISGNFDLVLMDVQMPVMDGLEATGHIRAYEKKHGLNHTPILAMTAHALKGDAEVCIDAGMDDYISKPINWKGLFAKIELHEAGVKAPEMVTTSQEAISQAPSQAANVEVLSLDSLVSKFNNDKEFLLQMVEILESEIPQRMDKISAAVQSRNFSMIEMESHALKSMLGNFGKTGAYHASRQLETAGHKELSSAIDEQFSHLEQEVSQFMTNLRELF